MEPAREIQPIKQEIIEDLFNKTSSDDLVRYKTNPGFSTEKIAEVCTDVIKSSRSLPGCPIRPVWEIKYSCDDLKYNKDNKWIVIIPSIFKEIFKAVTTIDLQLKNTFLVGHFYQETFISLSKAPPLSSQTTKKRNNNMNVSFVPRKIEATIIESRVKEALKKEPTSISDKFYEFHNLLSKYNLNYGDVAEVCNGVIANLKKEKGDKYNIKLELRDWTWGKSDLKVDPEILIQIFKYTLKVSLIEGCCFLTKNEALSFLEPFIEKIPEAKQSPLTSHLLYMYGNKMDVDYEVTVKDDGKIMAHSLILKQLNFFESRNSACLECFSSKVVDGYFRHLYGQKLSEDENIPFYCEMVELVQHVGDEYFKLSLLHLIRGKTDQTNFVDLVTIEYKDEDLNLLSSWILNKYSKEDSVDLSKASKASLKTLCRKLKAEELKEVSWMNDLEIGKRTT